MIQIFNKSFKLLISLILFISIFFIPTLNSNITNSNTNNNILNTEILEINPNGYVWPLPGYTRISSPYGKRHSPTQGASSFHYGIDIPAPPGTNFIAVHDGEITFRQFLGPGGYTITLSFDNYKISYCHCNPNFIVKVGDKVKQGQIIGQVGPKYVNGVPGNKYHDGKGYTNGATTGPHLHLGVRIDNKYQNPINLFK